MNTNPRVNPTIDDGPYLHVFLHSYWFLLPINYHIDTVGRSEDTDPTFTNKYQCTRTLDWSSVPFVVVESFWDILYSHCQQMIVIVHIPINADPIFPSKHEQMQTFGRYDAAVGGLYSVHAIFYWILYHTQCYKWFSNSAYQKNTLRRLKKRLHNVG